MVQTRITKSLPSAAWKILVLGFLKLLHKFKGTKALNEKGVGKICDFWPVSRCISVTRDRPEQAAYEIFSIEHRFQWPKFRPSRFKKTCTEGHQRVVRSKSHYFTAVSQSSTKTAAYRHRHAVYHNKH